MLLSRRAREVIFSVLLFAVPVVLLYGNLGRPSHLNLVDRVVLRISSGLQRLVVSATTGTINLYRRYVALWDLKRKNAALRRRNIELRENNAILRAWAAQGRTLERKLGFAVRPPLKMVPADVVAPGVSPFYQVLRIRLRPAKATARPGQAVSVPAGLVGRIRRVYGAYADVLLATDAECRIKVSVKRTESLGELRGTGRTGILEGRVEYLSRRDTVEIGDQVVTSGMDERYPRGLLVGRIAAIHRRIRGRYQAVAVQAAVDPSAHRTVYLVKTQKAARRPGRRPRKVR